MRRKHGIEAFGLALMVALGLMAVGAAGAQAAIAGIWLYDGKPIPEGERRFLTSSSDTLVNILTELKGGVKVEVDCKKTTESIAMESGGKGEVNLEYTGCSTKLAACKVAEPITATLATLVLLHKPAGHTVELTYLVTHAPGGVEGTFMTLKFSGAECIIPAEIKITGNSVKKDCEGTILTDKRDHLMEEVPGGLGLAGETGLKFGTQSVSIDGSVIWSVTFSHTWAAH